MKIIPFFCPNDPNTGYAYIDGEIAPMSEEELHQWMESTEVIVADHTMAWNCIQAQRPSEEHAMEMIEEHLREEQSRVTGLVKQRLRIKVEEIEKERDEAPCCLQ